MIEDSMHVGKYPLEDQHKRFSNSVQVINRSDSDDLKSSAFSSGCTALIFHQNPGQNP
jgi:hypothetical protein